MDVSEEAGELVKILETRDQGLIAMAKSLLDGASIEYAMNNEFSQNVWPTGSGDGAQIWVRPEDADVARQILSDLEETGESPVVEASEEYEPAEMEPAPDLSSYPGPRPEQPFIVRALWVIGALLIPLVLVIVYSLRH